MHLELHEQRDEQVRGDAVHAVAHYEDGREQPEWQRGPHERCLRAAEPRARGGGVERAGQAPPQVEDAPEQGKAEQDVKRHGQRGVGHAEAQRRGVVEVGAGARGLDAVQDGEHSRCRWLEWDLEGVLASVPVEASNARVRKSVTSGLRQRAWQR